MAGDSLAALVLSYLDDEDVALTPGDPAAETRTNTWGYAVPPEQIDVPAVGSALSQVASELGGRLSRRGEVGTCYAWYDEQAGQVRCSLSSAPPDRLAFGGRYRLVARATDVVALAAADQTPGLVAWAALADSNADEPAVRVPPFPVWAAALP
ncbi:hypothetical protein Athai_65320 [Actinocatenispora thailandica]|uniref:Uncharacterized protein n=1 Tax=Actinocatenispora thailandica TaxID=227318 RepID=A0A7R7DW81_9ACTN|nr:hypothetical protein Athai_65320 [Actinocatenispora thailandica]